MLKLNNLLPLLTLPLLLSSCQALNPAFFTAADDVLTNQQLELSLDKEAFESGRNIHITIDIQSDKAVVK
jgi:hypothetical protein